MSHFENWLGAQVSPRLIQKPLEDTAKLHCHSLSHGNQFFFLFHLYPNASHVYIPTPTKL